MVRWLNLGLALVLITVPSLAIWVGPQGDHAKMKLLEDRSGRVSFEFIPGGFDLSTVEIQGTRYSLIDMPGSGPLLDKGFPELPVLAQSVIIADAGSVELKIASMVTERMKCPPPVPSKGNLYRDVDPATVPYSFDEIYKSKNTFPQSPARLSQSFILRDFRAVTVQIFPMQYDFATGELVVVKKAVIEVASTKGKGVNELYRNSYAINQEFMPLYQNLFINYGTQSARYDTLSETGLKMLIITADAYVNNLKPLVDWKRRKGYQIKIAKISAIGNNATNIKNYIQNEYNTNHPTYVLLVGEASELAPGVGTVATASGQTSDPIYSLLAGNDNYPDIFIGRFSAGNAANVDVQVAKSILYEKNPQIGGTWYNKAVGIASNEGSPCDSTRTNWLRDTLLAYGYSSVDKIYQGTSNGTTAAITSAVNQGRGLINYIGHGSQTSWASVTFTVSNVQALTNNNLLPVVNSVACVVGDFAGTGTCFCEAWQWAGTPEQPRGSVVHYGSSINQSWVPPCLSQREATNLIARGSRVTAGGFFFNGSCRMMEICADSSDKAIDMFQTWHIFGDPSVPIRTKVPIQISVTHPAVLPIGSGISLPVHVATLTDRGPVKGALVCVMLKNDTTYQVTAYTNSSGDATLPVSTTGSDSIYITITGFNLAPYQGAAVTMSSGPYVSHLVQWSLCFPPQAHPV